MSMRNHPYLTGWEWYFDVGVSRNFDCEEIEYCLLRKQLHVLVLAQPCKNHCRTRASQHAAHGNVRGGGGGVAALMHWQKGIIAVSKERVGMVEGLIWRQEKWGGWGRRREKYTLPEMDKVVCALTVVHTQFYDLVTEDMAIEDAVGFLGKTLDR